MAVIGEMQYLTIGDKTYSITNSGGTVTSVGISNATNGGLTISGSPITGSGSITVGHSNVLTSAQTTQAVYPIKIDKNGHISAYGSAVTIPTVPTNISAFTNDSGYITASHTSTYSLPLAANGTRGGVQIGYSESGTNYAVKLSSEKMYVSVPWTDKNLQWTASTSSNTYYPLQSTSTATTSTANTLNGVSFYQYYNTAGGYRRLDLGNSTAYKSSGGAYGTIRLYGAAATYYGDLVPGVLGTTSGDGHISANRTWTLPDKTGTIALTTDIPTVPTTVSSFTNDAGYITSADVPEGASAYTGTISAVGTSASAGSNNGFARGDHVHNITKTTIDTQLGTGSGTTKFYREDGTWATPAYTTNTDTKLQIAAVTSGTTYYPIVAANSTTAATRQYDSTGIAYTGTNGTANGTNGNALLTLGNSTASTTANWKKGTVRLYGTTAYYTDLVSGSPTGNRTITFPDQTGTVALTSDLSNFITDAGVTKISTTAGTHSVITNATGAVSFNVPTKTSHLTNDSGFITSYTDENMKWTTSTSTNTYYPLQSTSTATTSTANTLNSVSFYQYYNTAGGYRRLQLGNTTAYTTAGGAYGTIRLYGTGATYYGDLNPGTIGTTSLSANRTWTLPDKTGTIALTSDIPTVPTITLNGSTTTSPSFYAPTGAGTSGQYLKSNGSGAPSWTNFPTIPSITLNGSATTSPSFYAPTSAGTSGYVLKSNGSGAPTWTSATLTDANVTQAASTSNTPQPILFRNNVNTDAAGSTEGVRYVSTVTVTPGTGNLQATTFNGYTLGAASAKAVVTSIDTSASLPTSNAVKTFVEGKGYITSYTDTNTTYSLSNALSSHKFTSTLTAGGSGSGTSTATMEFVAGTGITLTDDTTNKKITIASSVTAPTITLNGSSTTSPSFYAPTSVGTDGYYLKSNGSGAPTWASIPAGVTVTLNGSTTTTPSFYAPTSAGTNGYVLKSNGSGAPTWTSATLTDTKVTQNAAITTAGAYPIIIGSSTSTDGLTNSVNKTSTLTYNPSTQALVVGKSVQVDSWTWDSNTANHFSLKYSS